MPLLAFFFAALSAAAATKGNGATPPGVYQGRGYYFSLPKEGTSTYRANLESGEGGEQVYVFPASLSAEKLSELPPGVYGRKGVIKLEVVRPTEGESVTLAALKQQTLDDLKSGGGKVQTTDLSVLAMPGFYAHVEGKERFNLFVLQGRKVLYYVTAGIDDRHALEVVRSLGEGRAPPPPPPAAQGPVDPFGGRKLQQGPKDGLANPNGYAPTNSYAKPDPKSN
jgi:hypothetical protein